LAIDPSTAFVSYSREDAEEFALRLGEDLKREGASIWLDQLELEPGKPWDVEIQRALVACPLMLAILSPASVNSPNVLDEVNFALRRGKTVIPVLYLECEIPFRLDRLERVDFRTNYDRGLNRLLKALGAISRPAESVAAAMPELQPKVRDEEVKATSVKATAETSSSPIRGEQSFTGIYAVDVFISYSHIDNQSNWVSHFHDDLKIRLEQLLGSDQVVIWREVKLAGADAFQDVIRNKISTSALFIPVLTPRYVISSACLNELDWFVKAAERDISPLDIPSRVIKVVKTRLPVGMQPPKLDMILGYRFYEDLPNPDLFREFGSQDEKFMQLLDDLAQTVARTLVKMRAARPSKS
jgi:hypothetical protein